MSFHYNLFVQKDMAYFLFLEIAEFGLFNVVKQWEIVSMKCRLLVLGGPRSFKVQNVVSIPEKQTFDTFHNNNIRFTTIITCIAITAP